MPRSPRLDDSQSAPPPQAPQATKDLLSIPALPPPLSLMPNWGGGVDSKEKSPTRH